ncbi:MAG: TRAP transporter small permease subunit [Rubricella sp.]
MALRETALWRGLRRVIDVWALLGGAVLVLLVIVNLWSVLAGMIGTAFAGDVELTEMGVAAAAFAFLPFCQLHRQNVRAEVFTRRLGPGTRRGLDALASALALGFAALLLWRMYFGLLDQRSFAYSSTILQIPTWWVYMPVLVSLALLVAAAAMTLAEDLAGETGWTR